MVTHEQSVPGHWGFAVYVRKLTSMQPVATSSSFSTAARERPFARGGVGDLLQYLPAAIRARSIRVYSHYPHAAQFFARAGVRAEHVPFEANTAMLSWADAGIELEREHYPELPIPPPAISIHRTSGSRLLGVHPYGSPYSNTFAARAGAPAKWMPQHFLTSLLSELLQPQDQVLFFCSPGERVHASDTLGSLASRATIISCADPWDTFSMVPLCDAVVAVDSAVKTVASMLRVPTVTLVGDFVEPFRDRHFLEPYVRNGVMRTVRYSVLGAKEAGLAAEALRGLLAAQPPRHH